MATRSTPRPRGFAAPDARLHWSQMAHDLAPLLFAVPVLAGVAVTLVHAIGVSHPDLGFTTAINSDAEALFLGETIYQDPADGYTGQLYTPFFGLRLDFTRLSLAGRSPRSDASVPAERSPG